MNKIYQNQQILRGSLARFLKFGWFLKKMALKCSLAFDFIFIKNSCTSDSIIYKEVVTEPVGMGGVSKCDKVHKKGRI